jgi:hypothetical protein
MLSTKRVSANNECERLATPRLANGIVAKPVEHVAQSDAPKDRHQVDQTGIPGL